jgi:TMEM175 potassium channel family protein
MRAMRTESFSDGVFGFAATLLVLNVSGALASLSHRIEAFSLLALWPTYATYAVSFMTIGIMWINHHALFERVKRVDRPIQFINLLLLMIIAFIPFPTAVFSSSLQSGEGESVAAASYGFVFAAMGTTFSLLWAYAIRRRLIHESIHRGRAWASLARAGIGAPGYPVAAVLSLLNARIGLALYSLLALFYLFDWLPPLEAEHGPHPTT